MPPRFQPFGPDHLAALALTAAVAAGCAFLARRDPRRGLAVRVGLAGALAAATSATLLRWGQHARLEVWDVLPLHLCDFLLLLSAYALLTLRPFACEMLYFWACAGTLLALFFPDVGTGFPDWRFLSFFGLHGLVVASAVTVVAGLGMVPRPRAAWRAFLFINGYAAVAAAVNAATGQNYLFLSHKPRGASPLDWFGPWPLYILAADALALALFLLLELPFRRGRPAA